MSFSESELFTENPPSGYLQHCLGPVALNNDPGMAWVYSAETVEYLQVSRVQAELLDCRKWLSW